MSPRLIWIVTITLVSLGTRPGASPAATPAVDSFAPRAAAASNPPAPKGASALDSLLASPTLEPELLTRAVIARNPSLAAMRAAWKESVARADQAGSWDDPMADAMVAPQALGAGLDAPGYSVGLSQSVPLFGKRGLREDAARAEARMAGEDARALRLDLVREARRLYAEWFLVAQGREVNRELGSLVEQFRRIALAKYAAGTVGQQDALQAELEIAMLDHQAVVLERERRIVRARLNALLHRDPAADLPAAPARLPVPESDSMSPAAMVDSSLVRPEVLASEANRDARLADLSLARKSRLPEFTVEAGYDAMWAEQEMRPQIGVSLNLPIWFGRIGAAERQAGAAVERAELERLATLDRVRVELEEARTRVEETHHEVRIIETGVLPASERALVSTRAAYETNRSDFLALLNAERDLARARFSHHRAQAEYQMALADLDRALGRTDAGPADGGAR